MNEAEIGTVVFHYKDRERVVFRGVRNLIFNVGTYEVVLPQRVVYVHRTADLESVVVNG
jgi:hypothetical protein